jgi:hypothetical protein
MQSFADLGDEDTVKSRGGQTGQPCQCRGGQILVEVSLDVDQRPHDIDTDHDQALSFACTTCASRSRLACNRFRIDSCIDQPTSRAIPR